MSAHFILVFALTLLTAFHVSAQVASNTLVGRSDSLNSGSTASQILPKPSATSILLQQKANFYTSGLLQPPFPDSLNPKETSTGSKLGNILMGEVMMALVSTPAFAHKGAYWTAGTTHVMSLGAFNGGEWARQDETRWVAFGLLNALAVHHYFVKPTSGPQVFWRNWVGLHTVFLATHLLDKSLTKKRKAKS